MDKRVPELLPPAVDLETRKVMKHLVAANRVLAELKGYADTIPNKNILINAVLINEAKDSSEIENIITTHDDLYMAISHSSFASSAAKEVENYRAALWYGYEKVKTEGILTTNMIIDIHRIIRNNREGIRKLPGTVLMNERTGETVYAPPEGEDVIRGLLTNLEKYINEDVDDMDFLVKMALIHYQFECIHPFYDGNGRTGRIINVLYMVLKNLLDSPILYLSRYIVHNKAEYYQLLQMVRTEGKWEDWLCYILRGVEITSAETLSLVKRINVEMNFMTEEIQRELPGIYSVELINLLFYEFYTKISYIRDGLSVTRKTAASYLSRLEEKGFLVSEKVGRERIYKNTRLWEIVSGEVPETDGRIN